MEDFICSQLEECRIEFREEMRELQQHTKSQFGDIKSQFDQISGKLDAIIELLPNWLRSNGIEPVDLIVVPSDKEISNPVDVLMEVIDPDESGERVTTTKQSWIDSDVHRANNRYSVEEECIEYIAEPYAHKLLDEMSVSIQAALPEEQLHTKMAQMHTEMEFLLDGTFGDVQPSELKKASRPQAYHIFDEMAPTSRAKVMNELTDPYIGGINFNDITLFDPGGARKYALSSTGEIVPELFGKSHRTCDNGVDEIDGRKNVTESEPCSEVYIGLDELNEASTTALFNDQVNEPYAHYFSNECPQPLLAEQSDRTVGGVDKGSVVLHIMDLQSVLNPIDETTINGSCKGSTKQSMGESTSIMESVWGKNVMNENVFDRMTDPSPIIQHVFSMLSSFGMDETDDSYPMKVDYQSFDYKLDENMWLNVLLMLTFDPGGCSRLYRGCYLLEYNGEHGDFHFPTNVVDAPEYINYAFEEDSTSHSSKCVSVLDVRFVRVSFDEFCEQKQAFIMLMNSQQVLLHDMDKCNVVAMAVFHLFPFSHPRDVRLTSTNIFIGWKVSLEKVEGFFTGESPYSLRNTDEIDTSASSVAVTNCKVYVIPASLSIQGVPFDLAERALLPLVYTVLIEFTLLGRNYFGYQQRVTYKNSQLLDGFKPSQCRARRCINTEHLDVGLINKIGVPFVSSVHFKEMSSVTKYHSNIFYPDVWGVTKDCGPQMQVVVDHLSWAEEVLNKDDVGMPMAIHFSLEMLKIGTQIVGLVTWQAKVNDQKIVVLAGATILDNFVWDPGHSAMFFYILEDKDVFERVGKWMIQMDHTTGLPVTTPMFMNPAKDYFGLQQAVSIALAIARPLYFQLGIVTTPTKVMLMNSAWLRNWKCLLDGRNAWVLSVSTKMESFIWNPGIFCFPYSYVTLRRSYCFVLYGHGVPSAYKKSNIATVLPTEGVLHWRILFPISFLRHGSPASFQITKSGLPLHVNTVQLHELVGYWLSHSSQNISAVVLVAVHLANVVPRLAMHKSGTSVHNMGNLHVSLKPHLKMGLVLISR